MVVVVEWWVLCVVCPRYVGCGSVSGVVSWWVCVTMGPLVAVVMCGGG